MKYLDHMIAPDGSVGICWEKPDGTLFRQSVAPGFDLGSLPPERALPADKRAEIEALWTPKVVAAYEAAFPLEPEPEPQRRIVPKRVIIDRLEEMGLADAAEDALHQLPAAVRQRWYALSEGPHHDDEDTVALLEAIGADPAVVLAP